MKQVSIVIPVITFLSALLVSNVRIASAQLFVDSIYDVPTMAYDFFNGSCVDISNVTYQGSPENMSFFEGSQSNVGLDMGILLSSGNVYDAVGPNISSSTSTDLGLPGDADLALLTAFTTYDAAVLEMDITPHVDTIFFDYVFASEEYPEWVGSSFNDVFGFFISGPGINGKQNIALIPNSNNPVSINNVNCQGGSPYYTCNDPFNASCDMSYSCPSVNDTTIIEYDGFTTPIKAYAVVTPDSTYHIKIAVADASDAIYDSGIFLGINSLCGDGHKPAADYNYEVNDLNVDFENLTMYVRSYYWDFGDGSTSVERNPSHEYAAAGIYNVMLITTNYKGSDTVVKTIDMLGTGIQNTLAGVQLLSNPVSSVMSFVNQNAGPIQFFLFDAIGQLKMSSHYSGDFNVNISELPAGVYFAELTASGKIYRVKVIKQ